MGENNVKIEIWRGQNNQFKLSATPQGAQPMVFDNLNEQTMSQQLVQWSQHYQLKGPSEPKNDNFTWGPQPSIWSSPLFWVILVFGLICAAVGGFLMYKVCMNKK